jgi:hypothetical protein
MVICGVCKSGCVLICCFILHSGRVFIVVQWNPHIFFYLVCEAVGTASTPGLLCQPQVIVRMIVEKQMECKLAGETEVLRENLSQHHFCPSQNPTWPDPGLNLDHRGWKQVTNRLSYGTALVVYLFWPQPKPNIMIFLYRVRHKSVNHCTFCQWSYFR